MSFQRSPDDNKIASIDVQVSNHVLGRVEKDVSARVKLIAHYPFLSVGLEDGMNNAGHMIAGACAGVAEHTFMYPMDLVKTRMQVCQCNIDHPVRKNTLRSSQIHILIDEKQNKMTGREKQSTE